MACYHPLTGYRSAEVNASGKRGIVFNPSFGYKDLQVTVPCGQCIGCRLERSRQWAIRCVHEAQLHEDNSFITLTYSPENLPSDGSLHKEHYQKFMKRLRKYYAPKKIRYFHCGEYGEKNARPHYHACLFGLDFEDKKLWSTRQGIKLYTSETLEKIWPYGFSTIGDVTFDSAAYVARYIMKKVNGKRAEEHYLSLDPETGEVHSIIPEYITMSRRPGIASGWYEKYHSDVYPSDEVVINGQKMRPPKYYDSLLEQTHEELYDEIKYSRIRAAKAHQANNTPDRLSVREKVKKSQVNQLVRDL